MRVTIRRGPLAATPATTVRRSLLPMLALAFLVAGCGSGSGGGSNTSGDTGGDTGSDPGGDTAGDGGGDSGGDTGGDSGGDMGGDTGGDGGGDTGGSPLEATFASIQEHVFTPICTACHIGAAAPLGLRLDEANSYALLVGVPSAQQPALNRVTPGDPDDSYLIRKLEGTAAVGEQMPLGGPPLPQADIDVIRQWISDGALPSMPQEPPAAPVRVTSLSPLPDSTLTQMPSAIIAVFDRELDATSVNSSNFVLERSGGDGTFGDGNEVAVPAPAAVPAANPMSAVLDLAAVTPVADAYRVRLLGGGPSLILDLDSNALDGEFAGSFPSGDGVQGGDFVAEFEVDGIQPTLTSIQQSVFTPICSVCHTGPPSSLLPGGMDLSDAAASFASLVGVASVQVPSLQRVAPGDPGDSYLVRKLEGTAAQGARMPLGQPPLDAATIDAIRQWIESGAAP